MNVSFKTESKGVQRKGKEGQPQREEEKCQSRGEKTAEPSGKKYPQSHVRGAIS